MTPASERQHGTSRGGTSTGRHNWELAHGDIEAFGEAKKLSAWAQDPRCPVTKATLRGRLALGWDPEDAITRHKNHEPPLLFTHFDRSLTLRGWAEQSGITYQTLYTRIFTDGMRFRTALLQGPDDPDYAIPITAFGETRPLHQWALDSRTNCTAATLHQRIQANWPPESAITEKPPAATPGTTPAGPDATGRRAPEPSTLRIPADQLQPGDNVLAVEQDPASGTHLLTVSRPRPAHSSSGTRTAAGQCPAPLTPPTGQNRPSRTPR
ncbi:hypothetical protein OIE62_07760 [Streptomyces scopuliridis]|uniref:Uncharacterized protein n=1 Tax=Streptomyces scopuliridis TaxID=452529 RepID=A0ACD4ZSQ0_9ACTN|nr:hypothetical protein [Streptomyces scopuliridis]WSC01538.1 hypothetical protein OG835_34060 [Streptomyces scopuliridis]WSC04924.1 hypothetical protein OIE62_07760 [Streptomyces scopuliridis]